MKKLRCFLFALFLLMSMNVTAFAEETVLQAEIPDTHTVTVESKNGRVALDGAVCKDTAEVERHKEQSYRIIPDAGKQIDKVLYDGEDVTDQLVKGVFTAPRLVRNAELTVTYKDTPPAPDDKEYHVSGTVKDEDGKPLSGVTVEIGGKTGVTDEKGRFEIGGVHSGTHTVVITDKDGKVLGSGVVTIDKADESELVFTIDKNGNPVIKPAKNTKNIDVTIVVDKNGNIKITGAKDSTPQSGNAGNQSLRSGDTGNLNLWFGLLAASGIALLISCGYIRYRKHRRK